MDVVDDLVTREASGVLEVAGNPSGAVYLDGGRIAYARASWVPGLAARLRAIAPSLTGTGETRPGEDAADAGIAQQAVRHGYMTEAGLHELIGSVVIEAFLVLTIPLATDSPVDGIRFTPTSTYWSHLFPRLGIDVVRKEAVRRAEWMTACGLAPTTAVAPRDLDAPSAVLTREQWAVACQIGDRVSARELAMRRGTSLSDTVHCLGSLVRAGLCVPIQSARRGQHQAVPPGTGPHGSSPHGSGPLDTGSQGIIPPPGTGPQPALRSGIFPQATPPRGSGPQATLPLGTGPQPAIPPGTIPPVSGPQAAIPPGTLPFGAAAGAVLPALGAVATAVPPLGLPVGEHLPVRVPREFAWRPASRGQQPSIQVLRQVLNGLRKL